ANVPRERKEAESDSEEELYCNGPLGEEEQKHCKG
ncbi:hypothetical protein A2U01_0050827, partial [Trifolium medium]|nr:hypothetical protein [Trifolium medium]